MFATACVQALSVVSGQYRSRGPVSWLKVRRVYLFSAAFVGAGHRRWLAVYGADRITAGGHTGLCPLNRNHHSRCPRLYIRCWYLNLVYGHPAMGYGAIMLRR